jgi:hypothetical protein
MKSHRKQHGKINGIPTGRWTAYMAAAAASSVAAAHTAEAAIHYSGIINHRFSGPMTASFALDPAGGVLVFRHAPPFSYSTFTRFGGEAYFSVFASRGASANGFFTCALNSSVASVSNMKRGVPISHQPFVPSGGVLASGNGWACGGGARGQFVGLVTGFIGFKFNNGKGDQYGWARIQANGYPKNNFRLIDYAYGDVGDSIKAGQTSSSTGPALESLGGLAMGAAGLVAWRRRQESRDRRTID